MVMFDTRSIAEAYPEVTLDGYMVAYRDSENNVHIDGLMSKDEADVWFKQLEGVAVQVEVFQINQQFEVGKIIEAMLERLKEKLERLNQQEKELSQWRE